MHGCHAGAVVFAALKLAAMHDASAYGHDEGHADHGRGLEQFVHSSMVYYGEGAEADIFPRGSAPPSAGPKLSQHFLIVVRVTQGSGRVAHVLAQHVVYQHGQARLQLFLAVAIVAAEKAHLE